MSRYTESIDRQQQRVRNQRLRRSFWATPSEKRSRQSAIAQAAAPAEFHPPKTQYLHATNEFWSASATWQRTDGLWRCISADDRLRWMVGKSQPEAKIELLRLGCNFEWSDHPAKSEAAA